MSLKERKGLSCESYTLYLANNIPLYKKKTYLFPASKPHVSLFNIKGLNSS